MLFFPTLVAVGFPYRRLRRSVRRLWRRWRLQQPSGATIRIKYRTTAILPYAHLP